ncbi:unnamed protein product [Nyctereutes procyonoides]|uniref:(raccoon dog) hypothetical protein n=1 Tax=Nyctereutes procyonoides TaxID=34880 RepID=A0A811YME6_NYCPR|nr:unnamed protein product [Nyctereutes procyonoides]
MEHEILMKPRFLSKRLRQGSWLTPKYYEEEEEEEKEEEEEEEEEEIYHFMPENTSSERSDYSVSPADICFSFSREARLRKWFKKANAAKTVTKSPGMCVLPTTDHTRVPPGLLREDGDERNSWQPCAYCTRIKYKDLKGTEKHGLATARRNLPGEEANSFLEAFKEKMVAPRHEETSQRPPRVGTFWGAWASPHQPCLFLELTFHLQGLI